MPSSLTLRLPATQIEPLAAAYRRARRGAHARLLVGLILVVIFALVAGWVAEIDLPRLAGDIWRFPNYLRQLIPTLTWNNLPGDLAEWFWGWKLWGRLLIETLLIAYLGTLVGACGGFLLSFLAAANVSPSPALRFVARRYLEFCRTVPELVFALIFVVAFGLGPLPGVLALAIHTTGALGKLFSEVIENIDLKPIEGATAAGASWIESMRFAALPQVLSGFVSYAVLRFEINVRGAAIMGFVGAGGIGQELLTAVRKFYYSDISAMLVIIIATVMVIDHLTERLRHRLLGFEARP